MIDALKLIGFNGLFAAFLYFFYKCRLKYWDNELNKPPIPQPYKGMPLRQFWAWQSDLVFGVVQWDTIMLLHSTSWMVALFIQPITGHKALNIAIALAIACIQTASYYLAVKKKLPYFSPLILWLLVFGWALYSGSMNNEGLSRFMLIFCGPSFIATLFLVRLVKHTRLICEQLLAVERRIGSPNHYPRWRLYW